MSNAAIGTYIGCQSSNLLNYFKGDIGLIKIYNHALTLFRNT